MLVFIVAAGKPVLLTGLTEHLFRGIKGGFNTNVSVCDETRFKFTQKHVVNKMTHNKLSADVHAPQRRKQTDSTTRPFCPGT